ncbi:hypothetical protein A9986_11385 [Solibacillus silvestris]|nr:hypothetical protein [Solibacillus silvestris]OBW56584.1 hypothetical protein A9986_11385 [Solibacillus silvestris]
MKKEHWDEKEIELFLKKAPKVTDHRSKDEVFNRLKDDGAFNEDPPHIQQNNQKGIRWTPLFVSIASIFIIVLISAQFIGNNESVTMQNETFDIQTPETEENMTMSAKEDASTQNERSMINSFTTEAQPEQTLVYENELADNTLFEIGLAGDDAESVPVSILIPNEVVAEKTGTENPSKLELYNTFSPLLDEQSLGFNEYHPYKGELREEGNTLVHILPEGHQYDAGTASLSNYLGSLVDTFSDAYTEVQIENISGKPIYFDHIGDINEPFLLNDENAQYNYFMYQMRNGAVYLSPNFRMSFTNVEEAIKNMTVEANDIYRTVILPGVYLKVEDAESVVTITFEEPLNLENYEPAQAMRMIEGLIMTAAIFDKQVKFENIVQEQWGGFDFTKPVEKPIAANRIHYEFQ